MDSYEPMWRICAHVPSVSVCSRTRPSEGLGRFWATAAAAVAVIASVTHSG